ncbi:flagellar biosynthesis repressor FlbT [Roseivivax sp. CAU 1753]
MSGLVLKLAPKERILINGAVVENGDKRTRFAIMSPNVNILRLKDAIHPEEAKTPVRRAAYQVQLALTGDIDPDTMRMDILGRIEELSHILIDPDSRRLLAVASDALIHNRYYQCLKGLRALIPREDRLLATVQT